jgi:glycosyltransferase involved in cell wall biosynthesis
MANRTPRLAVVESMAFPAGSQNFWVYALTDPQFSAVDKHVLKPAGGTTQLSDDARRAARISVHDVGGRVARAAQFVAQKVGLRRDISSRALAALNPDLVWFNLAGIGEIGWIDDATAWCRTHRIPYWLIVQHVHEEFFFITDAHEARARKVMQGAARVLTVSSRNRASLAAAFAEHMPNVESAVNGVPRPFLDAATRIAAAHPPRADGTARFISPARFDPGYKGQHLLLETFARAEWRDRDWHLCFVGGGTHPDLLRRLIDFYGVQHDRITLTPRTSDMVGAFAAADVILMPSLSEGSPFALAEGMACGRPAVGTPVGGIDELVRDGKTGWLAHSIEPDDIAVAIERCWQDRARWAQFGRAAHELAARAYDLVPAHRVLLEHVLADARTL